MSDIVKGVGNLFASIFEIFKGIIVGIFNIFEGALNAVIGLVKNTFNLAEGVIGFLIGVSQSQETTSTTLLINNRQLLHLGHSRCRVLWVSTAPAAPGQAASSYLKDSHWKDSVKQKLRQKT
jgi:hypothetical protein